MSDPMLSTLGLAFRAGKVLPGLDSIQPYGGTLPLVLVASDASPRVVRALRSAGRDACQVHYTKGELGHAVGCREAAAAAVTDAGFAETIRKYMKQQEENA